MIRLGTSLLALAMALAAAPAVAQTAPALPPRDRGAEAFVAGRGEARRGRPDRTAARPGSTRPISPTIPTRWPRAGARGTEMQVQLASRRRNMQKIRRAIVRHQRKLDLLRSGITLPAPAQAGAASSWRRHLDAHVVSACTARARARSTASRSTAATSRRRWARPRPGQAQGDVDELARQCRRADAGDYAKAGRHRQRGRQGPGLCRYRRDVALGL
jgi:hypothetical protein